MGDEKLSPTIYLEGKIMKEADAKSKSLKEIIYSMEIALASRQADNASEIISDNFTEFGSSGRIFTKADYLNTLDKVDKNFSYEIIDFDIKRIGINVILATYKSVYNGRKVLRSSIWKSKNESWQLFFHQGTTAASDD